MHELTTLRLERNDGVQWIRLNRPDARNGIDVTMRDELTTLLVELDCDDEVRAIVVTGLGDDFCTGAALAPTHDPEIATRRPTSPIDYRRAVVPWQLLFRTYWE